MPARCCGKHWRPNPLPDDLIGPLYPAPLLDVELLAMTKTSAEGKMATLMEPPQLIGPPPMCSHL
jgi:hypothetical protein